MAKTEKAEKAKATRKKKTTASAGVAPGNGSSASRGSRLRAAPLRTARDKMNQVLTQARESLRILQTLERETLAKARTFVRSPLPGNRRQLTNDRILASLRRIGVAPQSEVDALKARIERLEAAIQSAGGKRAAALRQEIPLS